MMYKFGAAVLLALLQPSPIVAADATTTVAADECVCPTTTVAAATTAAPVTTTKKAAADAAADDTKKADATKPADATEKAAEKDATEKKADEAKKDDAAEKKVEETKVAFAEYTDDTCKTANDKGLSASFGSAKDAVKLATCSKMSDTEWYKFECKDKTLEASMYSDDKCATMTKGFTVAEADQAKLFKEKDGECAAITLMDKDGKAGDKVHAKLADGAAWAKDLKCGAAEKTDDKKEAAAATTADLVIYTDDKCATAHDALKPMPFAADASKGVDTCVVVDDSKADKKIYGKMTCGTDNDDLTVSLYGEKDCKTKAEHVVIAAADQAKVFKETGGECVKAVLNNKDGTKMENGDVYVKLGGKSAKWAAKTDCKKMKAEAATNADATVTSAPKKDCVCASDSTTSDASNLSPLLMTTAAAVYAIVQ